MKLFHRSELIGVIRNASGEGTWLTGDLELTPAAQAYKDLFAFLTDEDRMLEVPPFSKDMLNNWYIEDEHGQRKPVFVPAVHNDGKSIEWHW